eukprot:scaffold113231_cov16-Tisochrysis_lutea.AAC.1
MLLSGPSLDTGHPTPAGNSALPSKSHLPFSQGPRDCIGQNLGNVVVRTLVLDWASLSQEIGSDSGRRIEA